MKFQYHYSYLSPILDVEIGFKKYIESFNFEIPFIPLFQLKPLNQIEAEKHYAKLQTILDKKLNVDELINFSQELPYIDDIFPHFKKKELQLHHLFALGHFIKKLEPIHSIEKELILTEDQKIIIPEILRILGTYLNSNFDNFKETDKEKKLQEKIVESKSAFLKEIEAIENEIFNTTGQKIIYPYAKEIPLDSTKIDSFKTIKNIKIKKLKKFFQIEIKIPSFLEKHSREIKRLEIKYQETLNEKLVKINADLSGCLLSFENYYRERIKRTWQYIISEGVKKNSNTLTLPELIENQNDTIIEGGSLPLLQEISGKHYKNLDLKLNTGTQILLGGNMTGKTTVLKTLYFILLSIKMGLPVTAKRVKTKFPNEVYLLLKSSGQLEKGLSSFGEEVNFFCQEFKANSFLLVDELFQSTDPVNGVRLSNIFLSYFDKINLVFFCSSQYPDVLKREGSKRFFMKTNDKNLGELSKPLFELEEIDDLNNSPLDNKYPLKLAMTFPLPSVLKEQIKNAL